MFKGQNQEPASSAFLEKSGVSAVLRRDFCGSKVSAVAMGTYLGAMDFPTDRLVTQATLEAAAMGVNFFDSAINYRGQRGERALADGLRQLFLTGRMKREEAFVSTKGGYVPLESGAGEDEKAIFLREYAGKGIVPAGELVAECHCMHPAYLEDQLERSRRNLQLETIDLYYIHNPETQLEEYPERLFYERLHEAFSFLEKARADGRIGAYGLATWDGFRQIPDAPGHLDLKKALAAAQAAAPTAADCGFKAIQLPFNLVMLEAAFLRTQDRPGAQSQSTVECAKELGISVAVSAPLYQGRIAGDLPPFIQKHFKGRGLTDAQIALLFALSVPGVASAMTGMKDPGHVRENTALLKGEPLPLEAINAVVRSVMTRE